MKAIAGLFILFVLAVYIGGWPFAFSALVGYSLISAILYLVRR